MAWTNWGFDGTINEAQWSQMAGLLGNGYVAAGNGDCLVTAVAGARSVSVAAGTLYGDGVVSVNSAPETVAMTTPVNGQWYLICLKREWATNTASLRAVAGATTTTTTPTAPPTSFPTINTQPGVITDQPIAWAWCNSANTTVVVYDIRLKAVKSMPPVVANAAERDAKFMTPYQGLQVWRDDLGAVETYYGLYNASTNPGGRDSAGWYVETRQTGLTPVRPGTVTVVTGSATVNALGQITASGVQTLIIDNIFTSNFTNYKIILSGGSVTATNRIAFRFVKNGTQESGTTAYKYAGLASFSSGSTSAHTSNGNSYINLGQHQTVAGAFSLSYDIFDPVNGLRLSMSGKTTSWNSAFTEYSMSGWLDSGFANAWTGIALIGVDANYSGKIQIFGYND